MSRFYLRLTLIPIVLFTVVLILIHAQPYDDHELRELLLPEGCPAPCFMGIRPGVTTVDEAITILEGSGWTENIKLVKNEVGKLTDVEWKWSDKTSVILNRQVKSKLLVSYSGTLIDQIIVETTVPIFDIYLLLGEPDATDSSPPGFTTENVAYVLALYLKIDSFVTSRVYCPVSKEKFLNSPATITLMTDNFIRQMTGYSSIDHYC